MLRLNEPAALPVVRCWSFAAPNVDSKPSLKGTSRMCRHRWALCQLYFIIFILYFSWKLIQHEVWNSRAGNGTRTDSQSSRCIIARTRPNNTEQQPLYPMHHCSHWCRWSFKNIRSAFIVIFRSLIATSMKSVASTPSDLNISTATGMKHYDVVSGPVPIHCLDQKQPAGGGWMPICLDKRNPTPDTSHSIVQGYSDTPSGRLSSVEVIVVPGDKVLQLTSEHDWYGHWPRCDVTVNSRLRQQSPWLPVLPVLPVYLFYL